MRTRFVYVPRALSRQHPRKLELVGVEIAADQRQIRSIFPRLSREIVPFGFREIRPTRQWRRHLQDVEERSIEQSKYSSIEFQGFMGLTPGEPIGTMSQSCCRIAASDSPGQWFQPTGTSL